VLPLVNYNSVIFTVLPLVNYNSVIFTVLPLVNYSSVIFTVGVPVRSTNRAVVFWTYVCTHGLLVHQSSTEATCR